MEGDKTLHWKELDWEKVDFNSGSWCYGLWSNVEYEVTNVHEDLSVTKYILPKALGEMLFQRYQAGRNDKLNEIRSALNT